MIPPEYELWKIDFTRRLAYLKWYAAGMRYGNKPKHRPPRSEDELFYQLGAALIKDQTDDFVPIHEQKVTVTFTVPASWFDHLKTKLPPDLKFGWLTPRYEVLQKKVVQSTTLTLNRYTIYVTENSSECIEYLTTDEPAPIDLRDWVPKDKSRYF